MTNEPGLRERKKQQTRHSIAGVAFDLFIERGFEAVTVAEIARHAEVSEATVFNHFPTKEDLVYSRFREFAEQLLSAVRERPAGQSIPAAFHQFLRRIHGLPIADRLERITRMVAASSALQARERQIFEVYTDELAALIATETGARPGDVEPWVLANALIGVHRSLILYARRAVLAGTAGPTLGRRLRAQCDKGMALLFSAA
jgi:AcrR family transcriptional regulator